MTDNMLAICVDAVCGFALDEKKWGYFRVDLIQDLDFDSGVFERSLMLDTRHKKMILSLVEMQG